MGVWGDGVGDVPRGRVESWLTLMLRLVSWVAWESMARGTLVMALCSRHRDWRGRGGGEEGERRGRGGREEGERRGRGVNTQQ